MFFLVVLMTLYFLLQESVSISVLVSLENWVSLALSPWLHKVHLGVSEISSVRQMCDVMPIDLLLVLWIDLVT